MRVFANLADNEKDPFISGIRAVHETLFGFCLHDWEGTPCRNHGACLGCGDFVARKGDEQQIKALREFQAKARLALSLTEQNLHKDLSANWVAFYSSQVQECDDYSNGISMQQIPRGSSFESIRARHLYFSERLNRSTMVRPSQRIHVEEQVHEYLKQAVQALPTECPITMKDVAERFGISTMLVQLWATDDATRSGTSTTSEVLVRETTCP